jgi:carbonic anhydrase/acetyltransferase-like protein (isoleucine patch superfamily)
VGTNARIAPGVMVKGPVLVGAECRIEPGALILPGTILGAGTMVCRGACVWSAILGAGCRVGPGAIARDCIIDDDVQLGANSVVSAEAVIGHGSCLKAGAQVGSGLWAKLDLELPDRRNARAGAIGRPFLLEKRSQTPPPPRAEPAILFRKQQTVLNREKKRWTESFATAARRDSGWQRRWPTGVTMEKGSWCWASPAAASSSPTQWRERCTPPSMS